MTDFNLVSIHNDNYGKSRMMVSHYGAFGASWTSYMSPSAICEGYFNSLARV